MYRRQDQADMLKDLLCLIRGLILLKSWTLTNIVHLHVPYYLLARSCLNCFRGSHESFQI